jgi:hypothetical protein
MTNRSGLRKRQRAVMRRRSSLGNRNTRAGRRCPANSLLQGAISSFCNISSRNRSGFGCCHDMKVWMAAYNYAIEGMDLTATTMVARFFVARLISSLWRIYTKRLGQAIGAAPLGKNTTGSA